ncbi:MAG: hypothetical protein LUG95_03370 [Clostridiales bacterium]|nr:hypothetical protein [Clostridiales bacterium]
MKELIRGGARIIHMRYAVGHLLKNLDAPYAQTESIKSREALSRAQLFYQGNYSSGQKFIENLNDFLVSVLGVITASALLYKINFLVIVLILASCLCEFLIMKYIVKKEDELNGKNPHF